MVEQTKKLQKPAPSIFTLMARKYHLDSEKFLQTIRATVMRPTKDGKVATMEEIAAFLIVAHKYNLDPFTNEIYAFPSKRGGVIPIVGIDGFVSIMNRHPDYDGMDTPRYSEDEVTMEGAKPCPAWCEIIIYRKNFQKPVTVREYLDEVYISAGQKGGYAGPWQTHTKRMLRHKTIEQAARIAFGITGLYTPDEAQRVIEAEMIENGTIKPDVEIPKALSELPPDPTEEETQEQAEGTQSSNKPINEGQVKALHSIASKLKGGEKEMHQYLGDKYGANSVKDLDFKQASQAIEALIKRLDNKNG